MEWYFMNQETKEWMRKVEEDLGSSKHLFETYYPKPLDTICYLARQEA